MTPVDWEKPHPYRPRLASFPDRRYVEWYEPEILPDEDRSICGRVTGQRIVTWVCGACGAFGRCWEGEPPEVSATAYTHARRAHRAYPLARPGEPGCPCCAAKWRE